MGIDIVIDVQKNEDFSIGRISKAYELLLSRFYCREEGDSLLEMVIQQTGKSSYIHRKYELVEKLKMAGLDARKDMSIEELRACVKMLPDGIKMDRMMFDVLFSFYREFETPAKQMENIVRKIGVDKYRNCSVRLSILKQFILNTDYHTGPVREMIRSRIHTETGNVVSRYKVEPEFLADWADESLFNVLSYQLTKDEKKKYALLRLCDDLASGRFRTNGSTRYSLYMFAFAFDMIFYPDTTSSDYDQAKDIEKNLFFDYYGNHMLRYLDGGEKQNSSDYESAPTGEGINYKNYAEIVYLYYLNRKDLTIRERIRRSESMIEKCKQLAVKKTKTTTTGKQSGKKDATNENYTYVYKDYCLETLYKLDEDKIPEHILKHFLCLEKKAYRTSLMVSSETMTAMYHYRSFIKRRFKIQSSKKLGVEKLLSDNPDWDESYVRLIRKLNEMLHPTIKTLETHLTRDELIAVFYDYCCTDTSQEGMSLKELYDDCCQKLNPILADSRFQPLKVTNIFDIFMIIMLYRYLNMV